MAVSSGKLNMISAAVNRFALQIVEVQLQLRCHKGSGRQRQEAKPVDNKLEKERRHQRALGVMQPIFVAPIKIGIPRRRQIGPVALDQIFDDQAGLGQLSSVVLDHRRFAERVDVLQFLGRQHCPLVALIANDFVGRAQFFEQPEDALAA